MLDLVAGVTVAELPPAAPEALAEAPGDGLYRRALVGALERMGESRRAKAVGSCGRTAAWFRCQWEGRDLFRVIRCGRQECHDCGQADSEAHKRRVGRARDHVGPFRAGYKLVFTVPPELRGQLESKAAVGQLHRAAWRALVKAWGEPEWGALTALHYFGDRKRTWLTWHPHVELLAPGPAPWREREELAALREAWAVELHKLTGVAPRRRDDGSAVVSVWYGRRRNAAQWHHALRYALRPTVGPSRFLDLANLAPDLARLVLDCTTRVDNVRYFGRLSSRQYRATLAELAQLQRQADRPDWLHPAEAEADADDDGAGCPACGAAVEWVGSCPVSELSDRVRAGPGSWWVEWSAAELAAGALRLIPERTPNAVCLPADIQPEPDTYTAPRPVPVQLVFDCVAGAR